MSGPWGGGNKTVKNLCEKIKQEGHEIFFDLDRPDFDIIFCIDPRPNNEGIWYQHFLNYKNQYGAKIVQRIGDLGTHGKPELFELVQQCLKYSDHFIFPSEWAKEASRIKTSNFSVIRNRPRKIFHSLKNNNTIKSKPRFVTHHWSNNPKKGFDTYKFIDENMTDQIDFTYIGRVPSGFTFNNSTYVSPVEDEKICEILSSQDVYLTASKEEAGANHVLEAMACGLPVVYHESGGSINEYVGNRGFSFSSNNNLANAIEEIRNNFKKYKNACLEYNEAIDETTQEYFDLLCQI